MADQEYSAEGYVDPFETEAWRILATEANAILGCESFDFDFLQYSISPSYETTLAGKIPLERLCVRKGKQHFEWRYAVWYMHEDYEHHRQLMASRQQPTEKDLIPAAVWLKGILDKSAYQQSVEAMPLITLSPFPKDYNMGFHGVTYGLRLGGAFCEASYKWWVSLPASWSGLLPILEDVAKNLEVARGQLGIQPED